MLFKIIFLTAFISIIKLYNKICQIFIFLNLMNKFKLMIFNFIAKRKKWSLVPPTLHYCGHNAKKIGLKKSRLKICTLDSVIGHLSAPLRGRQDTWPRTTWPRNSEKSGFVPPTLHYCGDNAKKMGPKKSLLKICTLHSVIGHLSAPLLQWNA